MRQRIASLALMALLAAAPARACVVAPNYNFYAEWLSWPRARAFDRATTVDWVSIEPPSAPPCAEDEGKMTPRCRSLPEVPGFGARADLTAAVRERLKGHSPDRFGLRYRFEHLPGEMLWASYTDFRQVDPDQRYAIRLREKAIADSRHRGLWFWDHGAMNALRDRGDDCGGSETLDPDMSYIVYRDDHGGVMAVAPVLYGDDELLVRLREAGRAGRLTAPAVDVAEYFRHASGLALLDVTGCDAFNVQGTVLRVAPRNAPPLPRDFGGRKVSWQTRFKRLSLHDWLRAKNLKCAPATVLVIATPFEPQTPVRQDEDWALKGDRNASPRMRKALRDAAGLSFAYGNQDRGVLVVNGVIRKADLTTGLALSGPDTFTVDQAFAWYSATLGEPKGVAK